jgi:hypothetical protein
VLGIYENQWYYQKYLTNKNQLLHRQYKAIENQSLRYTPTLWSAVIVVTSFDKNSGSYKLVSHITMVGVQGFEPWTPWSQTRCATGLRHTPNHCNLLTSDCTNVSTGIISVTASMPVGLTNACPDLPGSLYSPAIREFE